MAGHKAKPAKSGSLAQSVEQRTFNPLVEGSNPSRPTTEFPGRLAQLGEQLPYTEGVTGSIPVATTRFENHGFIPILTMNELGRLAQLGEHLPYKEGVTGSIPVATTKICRKCVGC